jgi:putative acetyltransferase
MMHIRQEADSDCDTIHQVNSIAFGRGAEADLVDALRESGALAVSLVAEWDGQVVGHAAFSPVRIEVAQDAHRSVGLAPVAVLPDFQRRGIAAALIRRGLAECAALGYSGAVVLGDPAYYGRFGFRPAANSGLRCEYDVPAEAFMALPLDESGFSGCSGLVRYDAAFANV